MISLRLKHIVLSLKVVGERVCRHNLPTDITLYAVTLPFVDSV